MPRQASQPRGTLAALHRQAEEVLGAAATARAGAAEPAHQPLGDDGAQAAADGVGLDAHVEEPADDLAGAAGVERGQDEVAGERGLERDLGGRPVADLADGDDLGVLAEQRLQARSRGSARRPG